MDAAVFELRGHVCWQVIHLDRRGLHQVRERDTKNLTVNSLVDAHGVAVDAQVPLVFGKGKDAAENHDGHQHHGHHHAEGKAHRVLARRGGYTVVQDVHHDDGHVVGATSGKRGRDQIVCGLLRGCARDRQRLYLAVGNHAGETVRTDDDAVAVGDLDREVIGVHVWVGAQSARDDRARGVHARLVGGYLPGIDKLLDVGVVARHAHQRPGVEEVDARIANVGYGHAAALDECRRCRATHAGLAAAFLGTLNDGQVGGLDCGAQEGVVRRSGGLLANGLDCDGACHFAGSVAAHAITHGKAGRADEE